MKINTILTLAASLAISLFFVGISFAGPYSVDDWIAMDSPSIQGWATGWTNYEVGTHVDVGWQNPQKALGKAVGDSYDIVSLGRGGAITMTFSAPIVNGSGSDFAVFENSFSDTFLELAYVEVSSDGQNFVRFFNSSLTRSPVSGYGNVDPSNIYQLAGKHKQGKGTLFDLDMILSSPGYDSSIIDLDNIGFIRLVDIVGDGTQTDTSGGVIYDPYPTWGSAGFDLDAIAVLNQGAAPSAPVPLPGGILLLGSGMLGIARLRRKRG